MDDTMQPLDEAQALREDVAEVVAQVRERRIPQRYYRHNPYIVLAAAAGVGYVAGGGIFSPFTRRLVRIGMKALFVPIAAAQFKGTLGAEE